MSNKALLKQLSLTENMCSSIQVNTFITIITSQTATTPVRKHFELATSTTTTMLALSRMAEATETSVALSCSIEFGLFIETRRRRMMRIQITHLGSIQ